MNKVLDGILGKGESKIGNTPRPIGEILNEYFLHSNAPLAIAYHEHVLEMASTATSNEKGGQDGKNQL